MVWDPLKALKGIQASQGFLVREAIEQRQRMIGLMTAQDDMNTALANLGAAITAETNALTQLSQQMSSAQGATSAQVEQWATMINTAAQNINTTVAGLTPPAAPAAS